MICKARMLPFTSFKSKFTSNLFAGLTLCAALLSGCNLESATEANPLEILFPYQLVEVLDTEGFREPSGLTFHAGRNTLFVIGDEGGLAEFKPDGTPLNLGQIEVHDFEGITTDPASGLLYAIDEKKARIVEIDPHNFGVLREYEIEPVFEGTRLLADDKNKLEAIAFVPDSQHPQGGVFYLANQSPESEASLILKVEAPLKTGTNQPEAASMIGYFSLPAPDLSDLYYHPSNGYLYVISDQANAIFELTPAGEILTAYALPGDNQEGVAIDSNGFFYLAQDSGGILKFKADSPNLLTDTS